MTLFDQLVDVAVSNQKDLATLRVVVEKELLHHHILRVLAGAGLLQQLTFIGGTCLRACYGSNRLSEDLDFTGGSNFKRDQLLTMGELLAKSIRDKYGLQVLFSEPVREEGHVDTWKLRVQTRPKRKDLPAQRINIDVCAIPSYEPRPVMLLNPYGVDMGTRGLILNAQTREEIFADKLLAFALRSKRIKNRDIWDIAWLHQLQIQPAVQWMAQKLNDHHVSKETFLKAFEERMRSMSMDQKIQTEFSLEMERFLPNRLVKETVSSAQFWPYLCAMMQDYNTLVHRVVGDGAQETGWRGLL
jgi:predicted nucleotidyltransferase component of viral defense system